MTQQRQQFSLLALLTCTTVLACVLSVCWSGRSRVAFVTSLLALFAVTMLIAIRQRSGLTIVALCAGPVLGGVIGGLTAAFDPMYILPEDRLEVLSGVSILGLIAGIAGSWGTLAVCWLRKQQ
jgi:hypothetical protein